ELDPNLSLALWMRAHVLSLLGRHDEALEAAERSVSRSDRQTFFLAYAGCAYAAAGRRPEADAIVEELHVRARQSYVSPMCFAQIATALGDTEQAFTWLELAHTERCPFLVTLGVNPIFGALRGDPRFVVLLTRLGLTGSPEAAHES